MMSLNLHSSNSTNLFIINCVHVYHQYFLHNPHKLAVLDVQFWWVYTLFFLSFLIELFSVNLI